MNERARVVTTVIAIAVLLFYGATTLYVQLVGVPSIAVLRLLPAAQYPDISLTGYRTTNDGGQGTFVYNGSATCTDDGGTLIQAIGGCYQRLVGNLPYSPQWFGAYCDNSHDDTAVLNAFFAAIASGSKAALPSSGLCKISNVVTISSPMSLFIPTSGGLNETADVEALRINASHVQVNCASGGTINGSRVPATGNDYIANANGIWVTGTSSGFLNNVAISGCTITNAKSAGIWVQFCIGCMVKNNSITSVSYAGILLEACQSGCVVSDNAVATVSSSNGPSSGTAPAGLVTNAYGIVVTTDGLGHLSQDTVVSGNFVNNVPTWECYDTHAGLRITFIGNIGINCRKGQQITTDGSTTAPQYDKVIGNHFQCATGLPIYPGGPSTSIGDACLYVSGVPSGNLSKEIIVADNLIVGGGSTNSTPGTFGAVAIGESDFVTFKNNHISSGKVYGIGITGTVTGSITGNLFDAITAGPLGGANILINVATGSAKITLAQNWGSSTGSEGYFITAQTGSNEVGIARDNLFFGLSALYDPSGPATNRIDLGATAP